MPRSLVDILTNDGPFLIKITNGWDALFIPSVCVFEYKFVKKKSTESAAIVELTITQKVSGDSSIVQTRRLKINQVFSTHAYITVLKINKERMKGDEPFIRALMNDQEEWRFISDLETMKSCLMINHGVPVFGLLSSLLTSEIRFYLRPSEIGVRKEKSLYDLRFDMYRKELLSNALTVIQCGSPVVPVIPKPPPTPLASEDDSDDDDESDSEDDLDEDERNKDVHSKRESIGEKNNKNDEI
jgi:hypothetical protein